MKYLPGSINQAQGKAILESYGLNPNNIAEFEVCDGELIITEYLHNTNGSLYLLDSGEVATRTYRIPE